MSQYIETKSSEKIKIIPLQNNFQVIERKVSEPSGRIIGLKIKTNEGQIVWISSNLISTIFSIEFK